jgi:hypothetical protein
MVAMTRRWLWLTFGLLGLLAAVYLTWDMIEREKWTDPSTVTRRVVGWLIVPYCLWRYFAARPRPIPR